MAVTGTNSFTVTRDDIIKATLRLLGVIGIGETPETEDYTNCSQALNIMIKSWAKKGFPLWVNEEILVPMITGNTLYNIGPTGGTLVTEGITITNGGTGGVDGTYAMIITDVTGTGAAGSFVVSGGTITSITITASGSGYTAPTYDFTAASITGESISTIVLGVTTRKPLRTIEAFIRDSSNYDTSLMLISRQEYNMLGSKTSAGIPNQIYYDNLLDYGRLYVFDVPTDNTQTIYLQVQRQFYDMTTSTDNFDFPQEWFQALKWGLACELLAEYGVSLQMIPYYEQKALQYIEDCFNWSQEEPGVYFSVDSQVSFKN